MKRGGLVLCVVVVLVMLTTPLLASTDVEIEVKEFLQEWKEAEKHGVTSQQIKDAINKLKTYKKEIDDEELLSKIDLEIFHLETLLDVMEYHKNAECKVVEIKDYLSLYPTNWRYGCEGHASANATISGHIGYAVTLTDAGASSTAKAFTDLFLRATFPDNIPAKVTFRGSFFYDWFALEIGLGLIVPFIPSPSSEGDLVADGYVYDIEDKRIAIDRFLEEEAKPTFFIILWGIGSEKKSWYYSVPLPTQYFKKGKSYDIGIFEASESRAESTARNTILAKWTLEEIRLERD